CLSHQSCGASAGYDHRYAAADEIGCEHRQPIILIFRPAVFNRHVLTLDITSFLQALKKRDSEVLVVIISGLSAEEPDHRHRHLLRPRGHRPRRRASQPCYECPPFHSITSSARTRTESGMVKPSTLAALRLTTSSNVLGCLTGKSVV